MNKKAYQQPQLHIVRIQQSQMLLQASVTSVSTNLTGNADLNYDGGGSGPARVLKYNPVEWEDWGE